ncbi:hypothetical protein Hanom_Chr14g01315531 [Helianthus anomalus]
MSETNWGSPVGHRHSPLLRGTGFESWEWHMSPRVRTRHGKVTAELAWSGSGSRSEITPAVGRTVHFPPPPTPPHTHTQCRIILNANVRFINLKCDPNTRFINLNNKRS